MLVWGQHVIVQYLYPLGLKEGMGEEAVGAITGDYAGTAIGIRAFPSEHQVVLRVFQP